MCTITGTNLKGKEYSERKNEKVAKVNKVEGKFLFIDPVAVVLAHKYHSIEQHRP